MTSLCETVRLGDVCTFDKVQGIHRKLPYVGLEHIEAHTAKFIGSLEPQPVKSSTFRFSRDHVLYGRLRPYLNKVIAPNFDGHCSTEIFPLKPSSRLSRQFLLYWLLAESTTERINETCTGARMPRADMNEVLEFEFLLPSRSEQQRIVGILDQAFDGIAKARANAEKNLQNARALFESHLQSVFTQHCDGWEERPLEEICENLDSKRVPITKKHRTSGEYPYYGASGIVDYVGNFIFDGDLLLVSEDGANLLARTYPIAFSISGRTWVNNHAHVLRFECMDLQRIAEYYLNSIRLDDYVSGMAQPKLNQKALNSIPMPIPPPAARAKIVAQLDGFREEAKRLESLYQRKHAALDELKKSLLHRAFSGQL